MGVGSSVLTGVAVPKALYEIEMAIFATSGGKQPVAGVLLLQVPKHLGDFAAVIGPLPDPTTMEA